MSGEIHIRFNGEDLALPEGSSVLHLLERLEVSNPRVAVERNHEIVPKASHASTSLREGDVVEVVEFVGGG